MVVGGGGTEGWGGGWLKVEDVSEYLIINYNSVKLVIRPKIFLQLYLI